MEHVVVVGAGVFGLTTTLELRRRGHSVTVVDPGPVPHPDAASTDISKLIRMDYGSDVFYHELAELALAGWDSWNTAWPRPLYHEDGILVLEGAEPSPASFERDSLRTLTERGFGVDRLDSKEISERFPEWAPSAHSGGYFNPRGGWAESGEVVARLLSLCVEADAHVRLEPVTGLDHDRNGVTGIVTPSGGIRASRIVIAAGAWTPSLLPHLAGVLRVTAQPVLHFLPPDPTRFRPPAFTPWTADIANTGWYGFPATPDGRVKVAHHGPGTSVSPKDRGEVDAGHEARTRAFLSATLPELATAPVVGRRVCLYCDSVDGDFLIDADPENPSVVIASGGSGHAFKFAPVLGPIVADVVEGRPNRWGRRFRWRPTRQSGTEQARFTGT